MKEEKMNKIFRKFNPEKDVVRCTYGRAKVRKLLDTYAIAAVNLYGIIRRE
jgi:G3E family GTPase